MSAHPSSTVEANAHALAPSAAGLPPAAAVAGQQALLTGKTHATTALLARAAVSVVPVDSAVNVLHGGVTPVVSSAGVVELQSAAAAPSPPSASADSAKSQTHAAYAGSAQAQGQALGSSGSKDTGEKLISTPSRDPIASGPKAMLLVASSQDQRTHAHGRISPPSNAAAAAGASAGVGGGGGSAASASRTVPSLLAAAFASVSDSFRRHKAHASSAVAQHDVMSDVDGAGAASSSSSAVPAWAAQALTTHCLVIDMQHVSSSEPDRKHLLSALDKALSATARIDAVLSWLPKLERDGLAWVIAEPSAHRLHLHFKEHAFLVRALKAVPSLVRCSMTAAWKTCCSGVQRHEHPEALHFACNYPTEALPASSSATIAKMREFLLSIGIEVQDVWQSNSQGTNQHAAAHGERARVTFWALPREADVNTLRSVIERVHRQHKLFGGLVSVQGPNTPQLTRCIECRLLGHSVSACPKFGGTAVRLLFKKPLAPFAFSELLKSFPDVRSAMLGHTHSRDEWTSAHKATLFFDTPSEAAVAEFTQTLLELTRVCGEALHEAPSLVDMTEASRKQECIVCGSHQKEHRCLSRGGPPKLPPVQQHRQPAPAKANAAEAAPLAAAASKATAPMLQSMCGEYRTRLVCNRNGCKQAHPEDWIIPPEGCCRDFYNRGVCKYGAAACKYEHLTLEDAQRTQQAAAPAPSGAIAAAAAPKPAAASRGAAATKAPSQKKAASTKTPQMRGRESNMFAPIASAAAAAPSTPRGKAVQTSSLASLASPSSSLTRSHSTPSTAGAAPRRGSGKQLQFGAAAAALTSAATAAAGVDEDGYQQQKSKRRRTQAPTTHGEQKDEEEEEKQAPRKQPEAEQQQQQSEEEAMLVL